MSQKSNPSRRQLALSLEREAKHRLPEDAHQALVTALADLLLEALDYEHPESASEGGDRDEP
jgi:hypothetical protein